jgi:hypothetical protein
VGVEVTHVVWKPTHRLVPSRYPTIDPYERVADPADYDAVIAIELLTNERMLQENGEIQRVPAEDYPVGRGNITAIIAAFTHLNPEGSRFSDGTYGVYYAAKELETAIAETAFHRARFLSRTNESPCEIDMRCYKSNLDADLTDIRGEQVRLRAVYDPDSYLASQQFGREQHAAGSYGIAYSSVRRSGGECVAVFRAKALAPYGQPSHYAYVWDGAAITHWYEKSEVRKLPR